MITILWPFESIFQLSIRNLTEIPGNNCVSFVRVCILKIAKIAVIETDFILGWARN